MAGNFAPVRRWFLTKDPTGGKAVADALERWSATGSIGENELTDSGVTAGTYGDATHVFRATVDAKGRVTAASNVAISSAVADTIYMPLALGTSPPTLVASGDGRLIPVVWS